MELKPKTAAVINVYRFEIIRLRFIAFSPLEFECGNSYSDFVLLQLFCSCPNNGGKRNWS